MSTVRQIITAFVRLYMSLQMITCLLLLVVTGEAFELSKVTLDGMSCQGTFLDSEQPMIRWEYRCPAG